MVLGGGLVGTETAEYLADKGYKVAIVEMLDKIAAGESGTVLPLITKDFEKHGVAQHVSTKVNEIRDNVIYATNLTDNTEAVISADTIVNALGSGKIYLTRLELQRLLHILGIVPGNAQQILRQLSAVYTMQQMIFDA